MKRQALTFFLTSLLAIGLTGCDEKKVKDSRNEIVLRGSLDENVLKDSLDESLLKEALDENVLKARCDGNTYKTVKIGSQTWMAENLNCKTEGSYCYKDREMNCIKYGRLYTWEAAQKACPAGWHLPSKDEFEMLFKAVGGIQDEKKERDWNNAGVRLKSASGWNDYDIKSGNGDDAFGFSALPAGNRNDEEEYSFMGFYTDFWSSSEDSNGNAHYASLGYYYDAAHLDSYRSKLYGFSVRCVKD